MTVKGLRDLHPDYLQHDYTQSDENLSPLFFIFLFFFNANEKLQYFLAILPFVIIL